MNVVFFPAAVLVIAGTVLTGCGDGTPAASLGTPLAEIDACALLTAAEIEAATGIVPGPPGKDGPKSAVPMCNWPAAEGSYPFALSLLISRSDNFDSFEGAMLKWQESAESMDFPFDPEDYEEVEGPGKVNAWLIDAGMLQAHRGNRLVQVYAQVSPDRDRLEASIALATHAMARLDAQ